MPAALFDSVADNLLHNALLKRQGESNLEVRFTLAADAASLVVVVRGERLGIGPLGLRLMPPCGAAALLPFPLLLLEC